MNLKTICFTILIFSWFLPVAQDIQEDIAQINESYKKYVWLEMKTEYRWYASPSATEPLETLKGFVQKSPKGQYNQIGSNEMLMNEQYSIAINHEDKVVMMQQAPVEFEAVPLDIPLDTILLLCQSYQYQEVEGSPSYIMVVKPEFADNFNKIQIVFDSQKYLIERLVLYPVEDVYSPGEGPRLEIDFLQIKTIANQEMNFSESRYVLRKNETWQLQSDYHDYELLTFLDENN